MSLYITSRNGRRVISQRNVRPRRRFFVPNLNNFGPRNLPIRFPRRRYNNRRPRLSIMYGAQQDLAFGNKVRSKRKTKLQKTTITAPVSESNTMKPFYSLTSDTLSFCQPVYTNMYSGSVLVATAHPAFYPGRVFNTCANFAKFRVLKASLHWVPMVGTTTAGTLVITSMSGTTPISNDTTTLFANLSQIPSEISPVWMCTRYVKPQCPNDTFAMNPQSAKDNPFNFYATVTGNATALTSLGTFFLEATYQLIEPLSNSELSLVTGGYTYTTSANGIQSNHAESAGVLIVNSSTVPVIDLGEFVSLPKIPLATTDYVLNVLHNSLPLDYLDASSYGTFSGAKLELN